MDRSMITYSSLKEFPQVRAFTTVKQTLAGEANPRFTGKPELKAWENRKKLAEVLEIDARQLVFPQQTHTSSIACLKDIPAEEFKNTDALVTDLPEVCLCIQTADCVPILIFDPVKNAIGAVHAGWRGTVGLITKEVVLSLKHQYFSAPMDIVAVIGPSIGPEKYEVGNEVAEAVLRTVPNPYLSLIKHSSGKYHLNLWEANRQILLDCGVSSENIEISGYCTHTEHGQFFSARREGIQTGRLVTGIMLRNR